MSGGEGDFTPLSGWNIPISPGDEVRLYDQIYFFNRVDPDGAVTFRLHLNSDRADVMIKGQDGRPRKPDQHAIAVTWREGNLAFCEKLLESIVRRTGDGCLRSA